VLHRVSIIILNWNGWKDTIECLESLYRITYPNYDVIVVDNGSQDDSLQRIKEYAEGKIKVNSKFVEYNPSNKPINVFEVTEENAKGGKFNRPLYEKYDVDRRMILIRNKNNYGFAGGNNVGVKFALGVLNPDYILLLNNDTVVDPKFLDELVKVAESDEKIGIVGPKIYYYDNPNIIQTIGASINFWTGTITQLGCGKNDKDIKIRSDVIPVDYVWGACFLIKVNVITDIGLLDPDLFLYTEEADWSLRAKIEGYYSVSSLTAKIWHKHMASSKKLRSTVYYSMRNRMILQRKYSTNLQFLFSLPYFVAYRPFVFILSIIYRKRFEYLKHILKGVRDGLLFRYH